MFAQALGRDFTDMLMVLDLRNILSHFSGRQRSVTDPGQGQMGRDCAGFAVQSILPLRNF